jgi:pimeloyl-ACP methyl ester carboxylesterase
VLAARLAAEPAGAAAAEARRDRRVQELNAAGFGLGWSYGFATVAAGALGESRLVVPPEAGDHEAVFWVEANGPVRFRVLAPADGELMRWCSAAGERREVLALGAGLHRVEIEAEGRCEGAAYFGLKGVAWPDLPLDATRWQELPATPADGFRWPFLLRLPTAMRTPLLLVAPNNTGFATSDLAVLRASAARQGRELEELAEKLGCPLLIPLFPRPPADRDHCHAGGNLYVHALSRDALCAAPEEVRRVDLQLLGMIEAARARLAERGTPVESRVLLWGFSAAGDFALRFAMLHPERVRAVAAGGCSWPIAPQERAQATLLPYPIGLGDLEALGVAAAKREARRTVRWLLFRGEQDTNEPLDFAECFSPEHAALVRSLFGASPVERWARARALYAAAGLDAELRLEPNTGHVVTDEMRARVERFLAAAAAAGVAAD